MPRIETFVIFDMETTGLPFKEYNRTKIVELTFVAVSRRDLSKAHHRLPAASKLTLMLNPQKPITEGAIALNGITNEQLRYSPTFGQRFNSIFYFLEELPKPVCLVAHNGNAFDYKILLAECNDVEESLPEDLLCVDSLIGFKRLDQFLRTPIDDEGSGSENMTEDEEEDSDSFEDIFEDLSKRFKPQSPQCKSFKLTDIYKRLYNNTNIVAHRTEGDCHMLLKCMIKYQQNGADFLQWADDNCKKLNKIIPLQRK